MNKLYHQLLSVSFLTPKQVLKGALRCVSQSSKSDIFRVIAFLSLMLQASLASALVTDTKLPNTLVIVSDRSAPSMVAGARQYIDNAEVDANKVTINIRNVSQVNQLSNNQLQRLINQHQTLLIAGVFGETVDRLLSLDLTQTPALQTRLIVSSDRRLMSLHQDFLLANFNRLDNSQAAELMVALDKSDYLQALKSKQAQWPSYAQWLQVRGYWQNRGKENISRLFEWLSITSDHDAKSGHFNGFEKAPAIQLLQPIRFYWQQSLISAAELSDKINALNTNESANNQLKPIVFIIDHDTGDQPGQWQLHQQLCEEQWQCVSVLAGWGKASEQAVDVITKLDLQQRQQAFAIIALQDFVIGGGDSREAVTDSFKTLNVPIFKGIRVTELSQPEYQLSAQGLPSDSVHYRVAMPELQGISQPHILALASKQQIDDKTGASLTLSQVQPKEVKRLRDRVNAWLALKTTQNSDKKVAIVYYNHPPGRHNIGADNLNVQQSLWHILLNMKAKGYDLGPDDEFPTSAEQLLDILQQKAVNLPQDAGALKEMSPLINKMSEDQYQQYFEQLPASIKAEMVNGPLGHLHANIDSYLHGEGNTLLANISLVERNNVLKQLLNTIASTSSDLHHALDGVAHKGRSRTLDLLDQLTDNYQQLVQQQRDKKTTNKSLWLEAEQLKDAIIAMNIEGIRGWGNAPGKTMVWNNEILLPGVLFGNVFLGPQPPRGWEINEELLHANMTFPPPHQYLAFYYHLRDVFQAQAIIHLGRHSTYEFLPKRAVGLSASDYPSLIIEHIPSIYPYIVDGVGEGIQAKRRGQAVMIDHLTPPLATTELYDGLLQLRQLIESAEAAMNEDTRKKAIKALRHKIEVLNLQDELVASMHEELQVRGIGFGEVDDHFLLHEVGHYLTHLQEDFMPLGLHVFGQDWENDAVSTMLNSIIKGETSLSEIQREQIESDLIASPSAEMKALFNALNGGFIAPGKGNDPVRTPASLPTGRNFYALDGSLIPSKLGFETGQQLATKARQENPLTDSTHKEAVILWASDAVRDEGAMIAFGMDMLGVKPIWNQRGILKSLQLVELDEQRDKRRDIVFTTSGLFRDLYAQQLAWLDKSVLLALAASKQDIEQKHPALRSALTAALEPIENLLSAQTHLLDEPISNNMVASNWLLEAQALLRLDPSLSASQLGRQASYRIFGTAPGAYGAGVNRLAERSGAWHERKQLGEAYIKRMSHAYGVEGTEFTNGNNVSALFRQQLGKVNSTYLGRASNLYGLIDNNDAYDYLGGLNLAIETVNGEQPNSFVISHANNSNLSIEPLQTALLSELRGRFLNRQWIEPLMNQGYAGARTMGSEFIENLWGWQATSPEIIHDWVWEDLKAVYIDDSLQIGLNDFLQEQHNVHVQSNILAIMLVAIEKGFWQADQQTQQQIAEQFANNIVEHGIPGSGHTHANHPIYAYIKPLLTAQLEQQLSEVLATAKHTPEQDNSEQAVNYQHIQEITAGVLDNTAEQANPIENNANENNDTQNNEKQTGESNRPLLLGLVIGVFLLMLLGYLHAHRKLKKLD
ncbi:hypothetical protein GCM10007916_13840 [Psychromonas marina]|uniref:CobN/magnesium chelatase domain-containing protein n=1 Tax=Psychromonas marina TaxID=88364 RepID=A0ABQ6DZ28_9GAMM|nr:cobaltochelatase subunit CobN [Psychromonas marina]GLS90317.1 hypothetical protein GCM10007916_13840 [Psychromonas marina]